MLPHTLQPIGRSSLLARRAGVGVANVHDIWPGMKCKNATGVSHFISGTWFVIYLENRAIAIQVFANTK